MPKRAATRLTDRLLQTTLPKEGKATLTDSDVPGLYIEGSRSKAIWRIRRVRDGRRDRVRLGDWPSVGTTAARKAALAALSTPKDDAPAGPSVRDIIAGWVAHKAHRRTIAKAEQDLLRDLAPILDKNAQQLGRAELLALADAKTAAAPTSARRVFGEANAMFRWAADREMCNPQLAGAYSAKPAKRRERTPSPEECRALFEAAEQLSPVWCGYFRLLLLTGLRVGECRAIERGWVEGDRLSLPSSATKSNRRFLVPLAPAAQEVLSALPSTTDHTLLFTHHDNKPLGSIYRARNRWAAAAGIAPFNPHDLRRSLVSWLASEGCPLEVADRILNHAASKSTGGVLAHYLHYDYYDERAQWLGRWAEAITDSQPPARTNLAGVERLPTA